MARRAVAVSAQPSRELSDLAAIGPKMLASLHSLGITTVAQLARCDARKLYQQLCAQRGYRVDPCAQDVFSAAIAHARDPHLDAERQCWWYWSRVRKKEDGGAPA